MTCRLWSQTPSRNLHDTTDIIHTLTAHAGQTERYTTLQISFTHSQPHWLTGRQTPTYLLTHSHSSCRTDRTLQIPLTPHAEQTEHYRYHSHLMQNRQKHTQHYRYHSYTHSSCRTDRKIHSTTDTTHTSCRTDRNIHSTNTTGTYG